MPQLAYCISDIVPYKVMGNYSYGILGKKRSVIVLGRHTEGFEQKRYRSTLQRLITRIILDSCL